MKAYNHTILNIALERGVISRDVKAGELIFLDNDGKATTVVGGANGAFVAEREVLMASEDHVTVRALGVAAVVVSDFTMINPFSPVTIGADGKGVAVAGTGEFQLGFALKKPTQNGEMIPVLLQYQEAKAANLY